jgi:hypothetical protein
MHPVVTRIPKILHVIWVGDETRRPDSAVQTWRDQHPDWRFMLWGNAELDTRAWRSKRQIDIYRGAGRWEGVADLMRYEILYEHGGVYVDADSVCVRPLDDWLPTLRMFAVWESEQHRPGWIANGFIGVTPRHPVLSSLVQVTAGMDVPMRRRTPWRSVGPFLFKKLLRLYRAARRDSRWKEVRPAVVGEAVRPWQSVGTILFTTVVARPSAADVTILPSLLFLPKHYLDKSERPGGLIYSRHEWRTSNHDRNAALLTQRQGLRGKVRKSARQRLGSRVSRWHRASVTIMAGVPTNVTSEQEGWLPGVAVDRES